MSDKTKAQKVLLIDGFSLAFRAFYAMPTTMTDSEGRPLNAIFGFISMIFNAIDQIKPDFFAICFDHKDPNFREALYPDYKAHRSEPPDEFKVQVPMLFQAIDDIGFLRIDKSGFEADDLLGTLGLQFSNEGLEVAIMSSDQDMLQIVTETIKIAMPIRGKSSLKLFGPEEVEEKYGFSPSQMIDYKALKGDASDNIPGVKGVS